MTPGARALVEFLAEQLAAAELDRQAAEEIDRTRPDEDNAAQVEKEST